MIFVMGITMLKVDRAKTKWRIKLQRAFDGKRTRSSATKLILLNNMIQRSTVAPRQENGRCLSFPLSLFYEKDWRPSYLLVVSPLANRQQLFLLLLLSVSSADWSAASSYTLSRAEQVGVSATDPSSEN